MATAALLMAEVLNMLFCCIVLEVLGRVDWAASLLFCDVTPYWVPYISYECFALCSASTFVASVNSSRSTTLLAAHEVMVMGGLIDFLSEPHTYYPFSMAFK